MLRNGRFDFLITLLTFVSILLTPYTTFSQEKITGDIDAENFASMMTKINAIVADFGDKLKKTKIGDIPWVSIAEPLKSVTLDEYVMHGTKTAQGTVIYLGKKQEVVPAMQAAVGIAHLVKPVAEKGILEFLKNRYNEFYKEIAPVLTNIGKNLKDSPVRLNSLSIEIAPFGIGGTVTVEINYESPVFEKKK